MARAGCDASSPVERLVRAALLTAAVVVTLHTASAQGFGGTGPELALSTPDLALEDAAPGTTGFALTAGPGNTVEGFDVEVVGLQRDSVSGMDLVLIRVSGAVIDASGGVAAGMSGSPVYLRLGERTGLLGAIAYVFPNADHSLALVTPIEAMRAVARADAAASDPFALGQPAFPAEVLVDGIGAFVPVATPILMSGADTRAAELLSALFLNPAVAPLPMQAAAATVDPDAEFDLRPGAAVAVQLMRGDVELSAVGTVTTVDSGGLLAFGHPFLGLGATSLPVVPAYVTTIVSSSVVPFKLANVGQAQLATVTQDRPAGLWARFDLDPALVSVSVTINYPGGGDTFRFEVVDDERLLPTLVAIGVLRLADRTLQRAGGGSAALAWQLEVDGGTSVNVLEQVSDAADIAFATALMAAEPFWLLATNAFKEPGLTSASLVIDLSDELAHASLEEVVVDNAPLVKGGSALLHIRLQPHRRPASVRTLSVPLPDDLGDVITIVVRGGDVPLESDKLPEDPKEEDGGPRSFGELLDALREQYQASEIVVEAITPDGRVRRLLRLPTPQVVTGSFELELDLGPNPDSSPDPSQEQGAEPEDGGASRGAPAGQRG